MLQTIAAALADGVAERLLQGFLAPDLSLPPQLMMTQLGEVLSEICGARRTCSTYLVHIC